MRPNYFIKEEKMVDLSVDLGGFKLKNPFIVSSSDVGCHFGQL